MTIRDIAFQGSNLVQPRTYEKPSLKASYIVNGINESTLLLAYGIFILHSAATTQLTEGNIHFRVGPDQPRAERLLELYSAAFTQPKTDSQATRIAELLVAPALLLGIAALGRGEFHMTMAVIRPDYFSRPAMAEEFGDLSMSLQAAEAGTVVLDPNVLVPIFKADYWVFNDSVPWRLVRHQRNLCTPLTIITIERLSHANRREHPISRVCHAPHQSRTRTSHAAVTPPCSWILTPGSFLRTTVSSSLTFNFGRRLGRRC
jgi:hypothetical protein